jgi:phospholipase/lecithinase/hemolysin
MYRNLVLVLQSYSYVQKLNEMGAKRIGFIGIPPIVCCPSQKELGSRECEPLRNQAAQLFNSEIAKEMHRLNAEQTVPGSKFAYLDIYYNLLDLIQQPGYYGECSLYR